MTHCFTMLSLMIHCFINLRLMIHRIIKLVYDTLFNNVKPDDTSIYKIKYPDTLLYKVKSDFTSLCKVKSDDKLLYKTNSDVTLLYKVKSYNTFTIESLMIYCFIKLSLMIHFFINIQSLNVHYLFFLLRSIFRRNRPVPSCWMCHRVLFSRGSKKTHFERTHLSRSGASEKTLGRRRERILYIMFSTAYLCLLEQLCFVVWIESL